MDAPGGPAVRLARLAVDTRFRGCGYGGHLLAEAIHRTVLIAEHAGVIGLFVDAKDETARDLHKLGFIDKRIKSLRK